MKTVATFSLCLFISLWFFPAKASAESYQASIIEVINGYSIKVLVGDELQVVRLSEIICPSAVLGKFPCSEEATEYLRKLTSGKQLTLMFWANDALGRRVCEVFLPDGASLGRLMVAKGYALQDRNYSFSNELRELEDSAKNQDLGVWKYIDHS